MAQEHFRACSDIAITDSPATRAGNVCSDQFGFYANPADAQCQSFIRCNHGTPHVIQCAGGLVYNPNTSQCTWPSQYQCPGNGGGSTTAAPSPPATTSGAPSPVTTAPPPPASTTTGTPPSPPPGPLSKRVVCYYPNWSFYRKGIISFE